MSEPTTNSFLDDVAAICSEMGMSIRQHQWGVTADQATPDGGQRVVRVRANFTDPDAVLSFTGPRDEVLFLLRALAGTGLPQEAADA